MKRAQFTSILLSLLVVACARPEYVTAAAPTTGSKGTQLTQCAAKFSGGACVGLEWESYPAEGEFGTFVFRTFNEADGQVRPVEFEGQMQVMLWMPGMGHGSSPVVVQRLDVGYYRASQVFFSMPGEWEIRFLIKEGTQVRDRASIALRY